MAVVELDSVAEEEVVSLPVDLAAEVAVADQHPQGNLDSDWAAWVDSSMPVADSLAIHMPLLEQLTSVSRDSQDLAKIVQGVGEQVLVELDFVTVADWQAQGFELVARVVEGVVQSVVQ